MDKEILQEIGEKVKKAVKENATANFDIDGKKVLVLNCYVYQIIDDIINSYL